MTDLRTRWQTVRGPEAGTPVLSLATSTDGLLAGGVDGMVHLPGGVRGAPLPAGSAAGTPSPGGGTAGGRRLDPGVGSVLALAAAGGWYFAGGAGGVARSGDGGRTWSAAVGPFAGAPVSCLLAAPGFEQDGVVLAGTAGAGVLRSEDRGRGFVPSGFGLPSREVTGLCALPDGTVLAATGAGVCRARAAGRAWELVAGPTGVAILAVAADAHGTAYAAAEDGTIWRSEAGGAFEPWRQVGFEPSALAVVSGDTVLVGGDGGVLALTGDGTRLLSEEPAWCVLATDADFLTGTDTGLGVGTGGSVRVPGLADVDRLVSGTALWIVGGHGTAWRLGPSGWRPAAQQAAQAADATADGAGDLIVVGAHGVTRLTEDRAEPLLDRAASGIAWRGDRAYVAAADGSLARSGDGGRSWTAVAGPGGARAPLALAVSAGGGLLAVVHDGLNDVMEVCESSDGGTTWQRPGIRGRGSRAAIVADPATVILDQLVLRRSGPAGWESVGELAAPVLRAAASADRFVALTDQGLETDHGPLALPDHVTGPDEVADLAVAGDSLYLLDRRGDVSRTPL